MVASEAAQRDKMLVSAQIKASGDRECTLRTDVPLKVVNVGYSCEKDKHGYYITTFQPRKNKTYKIIADR